MTPFFVSVSKFKAHCLDVIRQVEKEGTSVELTRHGKVVARLIPTATADRDRPPWLRLRGCGRLRARPEESVLDAADFEAQREKEV